MEGKNVFLEIPRRGRGEEAASCRLYRMYAMYGEKQGWKWEVVSTNQTELGGFKELSCLIQGETAYTRLKHEAGSTGCSRCRRPSPAAASTPPPVPWRCCPRWRRRSSTWTPADLRIDTFRASGAGGQHVNKTESAIRVTHLPTGTVVECQDQRSQYKNKDRALAILRARLYENAVREREEAIAKPAPQPGGLRYAQRAHPHLQLSPGQGHRPPDRAHPLQAGAVLDGDLDELIDGLILADETQKQRSEEP